MKVAIYSLGCKVNIYESEYVSQLLKNSNYEIVDFNDKADIYIINTCSVTNESDRKSRKAIREAKKANPNAIVVAMGCYTQINPENNEADIVIGNKDKSKILKIIEDYKKNNQNNTVIYDLRINNEFEDMVINDFETHTRAFVKIQDGCNAFCSYCIIPYTRGPVRSKKFETVIEEVTNLVNNGYKEIVLTGIHTGRYGIDINTNLEVLLSNLVKIPNIYRIRLSSIEINEITEGIIKLIKDNKVMAKHLHIPLQSGSDKILKLMNRKYDLPFFLKKIESIRSEIPDISITTDLIVGFPTETDADFQETMDTLNKVKFTKIHTFPYSRRDNTKAASMEGQISGDIKKKRVKTVINLSNKFENEYYQNRIGKQYDVLTEKRKDGTIVGHTTNYIPIVINNIMDNNEIVEVKIDKVTDDNVVYGSIIN